MVAYLEKSEGSEVFHQIIDFLSTSHIKYGLTQSPTIYASLIEQFWQTAALCTIEDGVMGITATIDRKVKVFVTEASIRRHLKFEDSKGLHTLPTVEIFEQLALMGYVTTFDSLTFQNGHFSSQWKFIIHTILHCLSPKKTAWEQFSSNIAAAIICLAINKTFNFSKLIFDAMVKNLDSTHKFLINMKRASKGYSGVITPLFDTMLVQHHDEEPSIQTTSESSPSRITSSPSLSPQTHPSTSQPPTTPPTIQTTPVAEEAAPMPHESPLQMEGLESELKETKQTYNTALTKLVKRVKKLEQTVKASQSRIRARVEDVEVQEKNSDDTEILLDQEEPTKLVEDPGSGEKGEKEISTADIPVSTASAIPEVSTAIPERQVYIKRSAEKRKDKGKAICA
ncbi:hypothetical protein Tco_0397121 [Tanacetum coccineum]